MSDDPPLTVVPTGLKASPDARTVSPRELKAEARSGRLLRRVLREPAVDWVVDDVELPSRPFAAMAGARLLGRRGRLVDPSGGHRPVTIGALGRATARLGADVIGRRRFEHEVWKDVEILHARADGPRHPRRGDVGPVFVRPDYTRGIAAGGSVGHIAGVLNNLLALAGTEVADAPTFLTCDAIPTVDPGVRTVVVPPGRRFWDFGELPYIDLNRVLGAALTTTVGPTRPDFVYHRYGLFHYATAAYARRRNVPLVLEYNGSEVWIAKNWGGGVARHDLALRIEEGNLRAADLVVVVSEPLRDELADRGVENRRILVNPNGVDPGRYRPDLDGSAVRRRLGLGDRTVIGFIGTFGRWHGAEVLAQAVGSLVRQRPDLRPRVAFLMVGDGVTMPDVRETLRRDGTEDLVFLPGLVPQTEGPAYLAAADILASPHVPNADGSRFIGSPTKLFEYLAMGRPIVASELDQIGDVLDSGTAVLVPPGDPHQLASGIARLVDDEGLRRDLGSAGRIRALERHTWEIHTRRIVDALEEVLV